MSPRLKMNYMINENVTLQNRTVNVVTIIAAPFIQYKRQYEAEKPQMGKHHFEVILQIHMYEGRPKSSRTD